MRSAHRRAAWKGCPTRRFRIALNVANGRWQLTDPCCTLDVMVIPTRGPDLKIEPATSDVQLADVRALFLEYASALEISLCFQNFEQELGSLPGSYAPPSGRLLLARDANQAAGCVAVRPFEEGVCEMKRLYVRPAWRRKGLGRSLAQTIIGVAREMDYECMRLDTLASMKPAISLYSSLGFHQIPAYYANPSASVVFMELPLKSANRTPASFARGKG